MNVWWAQERALYWTEIHGIRLYRLDTVTGGTRTWAVKEKVASFALCEGGGLVASLHGGFTIGRGDLGPEALAAEPWAGGVLAMTVDVPGLPEPRFKSALGLRTRPRESLA
jgi:hypothetical protein